MLLSTRERHLVMDLDLAPASPAHSRKSSLSLSEKTSLPASHYHYSRRSSASQIIPLVSQSILFAAANGLKRSPLAPLDPQLSVTLNTDSRMAHDEGSQRNRKTSITLTNATRPTPYSQRNIPRRPLPSQQRRTSLPLPALNPPADSTPPPNPIAPFDVSLPQEEDIYSRLSTFTFGDAPASSLPPAASSSLKATDDREGVSPLQRLGSFDTTPRQSVASPQPQTQSHAGINAVPPSHSVPGKVHARSNGWSSPSEDEDEMRRINTRSKMRAIDDGSRRPSLPSNDVQHSEPRIPPGQISASPDKGKGKAPLERERLHVKNHPDRDGNPLSSPSSLTTEGDFDLDTDVDLMPIDDPGRSGKEKDHVMSDRSSIHTFGGMDGDVDGRVSSDIGSVYGEDDHEHNDDDMDEDYEGDPLRKDSARTWTESTSRRGSLPMDIPYPNNSHAPTHSRLTPQQSFATPHGHGYHHHPYYDGGVSEFDARALAQAQFRRPSRSMDDDIQRAALHLRRKASRVSVTAATTATAPATSGSGGASGSSGSLVGANPSSEPDMRGVAMAQAMVQAHAQVHAESLTPRQELDISFAGSDAQSDDDGSLLFPSGSTDPGVNESPYQGLDLNYILSVSGPASGKSTSGEQLAMDARGSDSWSARLSVGSSVAAREGREREGSWTKGWGIAAGVGRRASTVTVNDDTFLRLVRKGDFTYDERRREWSFTRERAEGDGVGLASGERPGQEVWRCLWVGRYKVERVQSKNADPTKPPQVRLNIKHIPDPFSKGNTRGGPVTFIHKHSRAQAFSIFRGHHLPQRHLKTSSSILLAPKKVQVQFTSTRTTSKLSTHGLLDEKEKSRNAAAAASGTGRSAQTASGSTTASATSSVSTTASSTSQRTSSSGTSRNADRPSPSRDTDSRGTRARPERPVDSDRKGKGVARPHGDSTTPSSSQTTVGSTSTAATSSRLTEDAHEAFPRGPIERPYRPMEIDSRPASSLAETASITSEGSHVLSSVLSIWGDQSSIASSSRRSRRAPDLRQQIARPPPAAARGSVGSLDEQPVARTSHAEAFATLDPPFIEMLRMNTANYDGSSDHDSQPSRFRGLRKLFHTQPIKNAPKNSPLNPGPNVAVLEGHYTPPWLTMAARSKQEEQERVIKNLNDSFRDVGLLPSFKPNRPRANKKKRAGENVFDQIPDDSLYMLLPMWPGETDGQSMVYEADPSIYDIPVQERQYLLVYYVPMLSKEKSTRKATEEKKHARTSQTSSGNSHHSDSSTARENKNAVALASFNILARLVSYTDVNGSGIRVPTSGLSVTGPMSDAIRAIPQIRFRMDDLALIVGFCDKRERGVEILPEGAEKLGLCLPRTSPDPDSDAPLSSLGRAAVEMAWLGALAVMGFGAGA